MSLTEKQRWFVEEYCIDGNATQAAIRAGYAKRSAEVTGHENLRIPKIAATIAERQEQHAERCNTTVDSLTAELDEAKELARKKGQPGAFVNAVMGKAKLCGLVRDRLIKIDLPPVETAAQVSGAMARIIAAAAGELTPNEAGAFAKLLEGQRRAIELEELDRRISELEAERAHQ